jgi:hypothetical protein
MFDLSRKDGAMGMLRSLNGRAILVRAGFAVLLGWAAYTMLGQSGEGTLKVEIREGKHVVPAMVCVSSPADQSWRTPPDGRIRSPKASSARTFYDPPKWEPGEIGPIRLTKGEHSQETGRVAIYGGASDYAFWNEPCAYFVSKPFSMTLPAGKWRLAVERGIEYLPVFENFEIAPGQTLDQKIDLTRWVDMPKEGWYSGDDHVHRTRMKAEHNEFLLTWAKAEDVHVANILRMGDIQKTVFEQEGYGKQFRYQQGDYALASGQEDPRTDIPEEGHTIGLNITAPVRDTSQYHLYDYMFDGVHEQGGITGYAHVAWAPGYYGPKEKAKGAFPTWGPNIDVIREKVDFFEILQFRRLGLEEFYDFLNLGIKLTASAGSDLPWGDTIGESRVFVYTGHHFSVDKWFEGLKSGHTFVSNGPMLTLTAGKAIPGDELRVKKDAALAVRVRAWAPEIIGSPQKLELICQGKVIKSAESTDPRQQELRIDFELDPAQSQWIAARVTSHNGALAHTSPIYIVVNNKNFREASALGEIVNRRIETLDYIAGRLKDEKFTKEYAPGEVGALEGRVDDARERYKKLAAQ